MKRQGLPGWIWRHTGQGHDPVGYGGAVLSYASRGTRPCSHSITFDAFFLERTCPISKGYIP
jgi:hypothetical protein